MKTTFPSVDAYIQSFPDDVQCILIKLRNLIQSIAPHAVESISYGMPAYKVNKKPLVYFAAYKHHIGLYATPSGHAAFASELAAYKQGKGSVQFTLDNIPYPLIERMIRFRLQEKEASEK